MPIPPKLTEEQKRRLAELEPALKGAAKSGELDLAKALAERIQRILRPTGHESRLMYSKTWLFEAAMNAGDLGFATTGLIGVRKKVGRRTRVYQKATALLAVCHLRNRRADQAKPLIREALQENSYGGEADRRLEVKLALVRLFTEESMIAEMRGSYREDLDVDEILNKAGNLIQTKNYDEILSYAGNAIPEKAKAVALDVNEYARGQLPDAGRVLLPGPDEARKARAVGAVALSAAKRILWRTICDKNSDVRNYWRGKGALPAAGYLTLVACVTAHMKQYDIAIESFVTSVCALLILSGIDELCSRLPPDWIAEI